VTPADRSAQPRPGCGRFAGEFCSCADLSKCTDPFALSFFAEIQRAQDFEDAYPYIACPACHKRLSAGADSIDARYETTTVRMVCHHCGHRWEVPRTKEPRHD
jgi:DNA-directed RNA polymerase subunit RPC12/RpoP